MIVLEKVSKEYYSDKAVVEIEIKDFLVDGLSRLGIFITWLKLEYPDLCNNVLEDLENRFGNSEEIFIPSDFDSPNYEEHLRLFKKASGVFVTKNNHSKYNITLDNNKFEINVTDMLRSRLLFHYYLAISLTSIMTKNKAIKEFQKFIDYKTQLSRDPNEYFDDIEEINKDETFQKYYQSHNIVQFSLEKGKIGTKVTKCKWYDVMKELNDPEFSYAVCCHFDFEVTKNMNPNFELTRTKTLMQGNEYCDFCYHDTRIVKEVIHPSEEFWDKL